MNYLKYYLCQQQHLFQRHCNETKPGVRAGYKVVEQLAKKGKPFTHAEFVKSYIIATVQQLCREKMKLFQDIIRLSARTVTRRTEDAGTK
jgi:hypothetical protein